MAFGMPTTRGSYDADQIMNEKENLARTQLQAKEDYYNMLSRQAAATGGWGPGSGGFGGGSIGSSSSSGSSSMSSTLPGVGSIPSGPGGMPAAPSVNASPNLQSLSEQLRYDPWAAGRVGASAQLAGKLGESSPSSLYQQKLAQMATGEFSPDDPSYAWRFQQGQQAAERSLASRGLLNSGNAAIELQQYGQGAASQEYGAQFNRMLQGLAGSEDAYNTQMGRLMQMAGVNLDPTAGGQLNVAQEQAGIDRGRLSLASQELANQYDLGYRGLGIDAQKLALASSQASSGNVDWGSLFEGDGGGSTAPTASWDEYFAARDAARPSGGFGVV